VRRGGLVAVGAVDVGGGNGASEPEDFAPRLGALGRRQRDEALEGLPDDVEAAMAQLGAAGFKDVVDRLEVVLDLGIAVDRDAALGAVPPKPDGDAGIPRLLERVAADVAGDRDVLDLAVGVGCEGEQRLLDVCERAIERGLELAANLALGAR
jgi:hypothetical protein